MRIFPIPIEYPWHRDRNRPGTSSFVCRRPRVFEVMNMRRHELDEIRRLARPLGGRDDLDYLVDRIGDARFVLIGEASHGTSDFYRWRADLSSRLLEEKGFSFVAVEGDWPDCYRVNRWVKGNHTDEESPEAVLKQ